MAQRHHGASIIDGGRFGLQRIVGHGVAPRGGAASEKLFFRDGPLIKNVDQFGADACARTQTPEPAIRGLAGGPMRLRFSVAAALMVCAAVTPMRGQQPPAPGAAPQAAPRPRSPEIHPDRTVTFRLLAPNATDVILNGDWDNGRNLKMTKGDGGVWSTTVGPLAPQLWG